MIPPVSKGRPRLGKWGVFTPAKTRKYEAEIKHMLGLTKPQLFVGPVTINVTFMVQPPKKMKHQYPITRPDLDNYLKAVLDAANGVLWDDDSQIVDIHTHKRYAIDQPCIHIQVFNTDKEDKTINNELN